MKEKDRAYRKLFWLMGVYSMRIDILQVTQIWKFSSCFIYDVMFIWLLLKPRAFTVLISSSAFSLGLIDILWQHHILNVCGRL